MQNYSKLLRIEDISGVRYSKGKSSTLVIVAKGAPNVPDNGDFVDASILLKFGVDVFVPDYIGFGRSGGKFTPMNCIKTLLILYEEFKKGCSASNTYEKLIINLKYKRIIFIGKSFGGAYVPLLPKFNPDIKELALIYPAVDQKAQGEFFGEETNELFLNSMDLDGYKYLYRGIMHKVWIKHLNNKDGLSPMDNLKYLSKTKLFIAHGIKDSCINYKKSVIYYDKILKLFPDNKDHLCLKLYPNGEHGSTTSKKASAALMRWLGFIEGR